MPRGTRRTRSKTPPHGKKRKKLEKFSESSESSEGYMGYFKKKIGELFGEEHNKSHDNVRYSNKHYIKLNHAMSNMIYFLNDQSYNYTDVHTEHIQLEIPKKNKVQFVLYNLSAEVAWNNTQLLDGGLMGDLLNKPDLNECFKNLVRIAVSIESMKVKKADLQDEIKSFGGSYKKDPPEINIVGTIENDDIGRNEDIRRIKLRVIKLYKGSRPPSSPPNFFGLRSFNELWRDMWFDTDIKRTAIVSEKQALEELEELNYVEFPNGTIKILGHNDENDETIIKVWKDLDKIQRSLFMYSLETRDDMQFTNVKNNSNNDDIMYYMYSLKRIITVQRSFLTFSKYYYTNLRAHDPLEARILLHDTQCIVDNLNLFADEYGTYVDGYQKYIDKYGEYDEYDDEYDEYDYNLRFR